jgi:hypothetical protein
MKPKLISLPGLAIFAAIVMGIIMAVCASCQAAVTVDLAWDASPDTNAEGYKIYVSTNSLYGPAHGLPTLTNVDTGTNLTCSITNLPYGTSLFFVATAYAQELGSESDISNEISYTTPAKTKPPVRLRMIIESSCIDPKGPWSKERELETLELVSDGQKFFRTRMEILP